MNSKYYYDYSKNCSIILRLHLLRSCRSTHVHYVYVQYVACTCTHTDCKEIAEQQRAPIVRAFPSYMYMTHFTILLSLIPNHTSSVCATLPCHKIEHFKPSNSDHSIMALIRCVVPYSANFILPNFADQCEYHC